MTNVHELKVRINTARCKGCNICVVYCPQQVLALSRTVYNSRGIAVVELIDNDKCTSCSTCAKVCPDVALEVWK